MLRDRQSAQRTSSPRSASHKFSPSSLPHMLRRLIHFPHFTGDEILGTEPLLNWKVMRVWCQSAARDTGKQTRGLQIGPWTAGPLGAVTIKSAPESAFSSLPFVYFTLFLFSSNWGHSKTWVASYPSELFISGVLPKSLEVRWKNRTPHKTLKKASCFNILRGNWIRVFVKRALVSDWRTMKWHRQSSGSFYCPFLPFFRGFGLLSLRGIHGKLCLETKHKQVVTCYFRIWHNTAAALRSEICWDGGGGKWERRVIEP